jgi:PAS domain-containing protein
MVVSRWRHPRLRAAFELWVHSMDELLRERAERAHSAYRMWGLREVYEAFEAWRAYAMDQRLGVVTCHALYSHVVHAHQRAMHKVAARMRHRRLAQAFEHFASAAYTLADQRRKVHMVVVRRRHPRLRAVFELWVHCMDELLRQRAERLHASLDISVGVLRLDLQSPLCDSAITFWNL